MVQPFSIILGKAVRKIARLRGGSGSALPGLFVEKINPTFISTTLKQLPRGVVLISGTNGKTTTTKMVVELLEGQGLTVFTNRTGSNFTRGVAAALLGEISLSGKLAADIAVLELDEAHAVHFVRTIAPDYTLLLNVMRDQLDRFGEIDYTASLLQTIANHTTKGLTLNREDPRIHAIAKSSSLPTAFFGFSPHLRTQFPTDEALHDKSPSLSPNPAEESALAADVTLESLEAHRATYRIDGENHSLAMKLNGAYNLFNGAAALALVRQILGSTVDTKTLLETLSSITPAFGRGETIIINGQPLEIVLVKNPSGFRLGLSSFSPANYATMIAINDNYADGRDMSWLWDVDFSSLKADGVAHVSGIRAYDMALRLEHDAIRFDTVTPDLSLALSSFLSTHSDQPKRIYATYTAMLTLRRLLAKHTDIKEIDQ